MVSTVQYRQPSSAGQTQTDVSFMIVTVVGLDMTNMIAHVTTQLGTDMQITITRSMGKQVAYPQPGEAWIITSQYGGWVFAVNINAPLLDTVTQEYVDTEVAAETATALANAEGYTDSSVSALSTALGNGAWASWTPTLTNFTLGNGTMRGHYKQHGKTVVAQFQIIFGSTSTWTTSGFYVSTPTTPISPLTNWMVLGSMALLDVSAGAFRTGHLLQSGSNGRLHTADGNQVTSTVPWTWATTDQIQGSYMYETA